MMRNLFVRERGDRLLLGSGVSPAWLEAGGPLRLGPTPTPWGPVTVEIAPEAGAARVRWEARWRDQPPPVEVALAGHEPRDAEGALGAVTVRRLP
jgi:hypothetical protein